MTTSFHILLADEAVLHFTTANQLAGMPYLDILHKQQPIRVLQCNIAKYCTFIDQSGRTSQWWQCIMLFSSCGRMITILNHVKNSGDQSSQDIITMSRYSEGDVVFYLDSFRSNVKSERLLHLVKHGLILSLATGRSSKKSVQEQSYSSTEYGIEVQNSLPVRILCDVGQMIHALTDFLWG